MTSIDIFWKKNLKKCWNDPSFLQKNIEYDKKI